jgi:hypothetical protein
MTPTAVQDKPRAETKEVKETKKMSLTEAKVHMGPGVLVVRVDNDGHELQARPGDVVLNVNGKAGVLNQDAYEALGGDYDALRKETYLKNAVARRRDDGLPELTAEEQTEVETNYDKLMEQVKSAGMEKKQRQEFAQANPIVLATSKNAPPTANPTEQGTILGHPDLPVLDGSALEGAHAVASLEPATVALGQPNFDIHVKGAGFTEDSVIVFNGHDEPTTFVSANEVTTGVNMAVWGAPAVVPVAVRTDGKVSNSQNFEFTAAAGAQTAKTTPPPVKR